jgi:hypothetical protein
MLLNFVERRLGSFERLVIVVALLFAPGASAQTDSALDGTVTTRNGQPVAGASVLGSTPKTCCPSTPESTKTDERGMFHLAHAGAVVHFFKEDFEPQTRVIQPGTSQIAVSLLASNNDNDLTAPSCRKHRPGTKRIGGRVGFDVPGRNVQVLGGKPDVDYVRYVIKPKTGDSYLELWFGPYALSMTPSDDDFLNSVTFSERRIVSASMGVIGTDTRGQLQNQEKWRQAAVAASGGAWYRAKTAEDAALFDQIVDSMCVVPFGGSGTKQPNPRSKP